MSIGITTKHKREFILFWSPEGRPIARVMAHDGKEAKKKTPAPWNKYKGEVYVLERSTTNESPSLARLKLID